MHKNWWPVEIDHIDGNTRNNDISNLRAATHAQNQHNVGKRKTGANPVKNVSWVTRDKRWVVQICSDGTYTRGGSFVCLGKAAKKAKVLRFKSHGDFARGA